MMPPSHALCKRSSSASFSSSSSSTNSWDMRMKVPSESLGQSTSTFHFHTFRFINLCSLISYFSVMSDLTFLPWCQNLLSNMLQFLQQQYLSWNWSWNERGCVKSDLYWWEPVPPPVSRKASQRINTLLIHLSQTLISKWIDCNKGCTCHIILAMFLLYILHIFLIRVVVAVFFFLL